MTAIDVVKRQRKDWYHIDTEVWTQIQSKTAIDKWHTIKLLKDAPELYELLRTLRLSKLIHFVDVKALGTEVVINYLETTEIFGGWGDDTHKVTSGEKQDNGGAIEVVRSVVTDRKSKASATTKETCEAMNKY